MADERADDLLRLDYEQTNDLLRTLTDVRFKLLAVVPTLAGAAVAFLGRGRSAAELLAVGLVGLVATLGLVLYEIRNTQVYDYAVARASSLESQLGIGLFKDRPGKSIRVFGIGVAGHDHALAYVYGAAIAAWTYLVVWGGLRALHVGNAQKIGGIVGVVVGVLALVELLRVRTR
ncbi:MAG TPA: hypothetical protein VMJ49_04075 [Gaiellaceae bacterium]|nr:hypothetical protein [Gaiellaceae bacterium]